MDNIIQVNIAELRVAEAPTVLSCIGLGSCVGVVLYDAQKKIGSLAHVMLPDSRIAKKTTNLAKFADTAIQIMVKEMQKKGVERNTIRAKIFGGANMFPSNTSGELIKIGERNVIAVRAELNRQAIPVIAKDIGGNRGRTIFFDLMTGVVIVKNFKDKE